jgi:hypothetical protein
MDDRTRLLSALQPLASHEPGRQTMRTPSTLSTPSIARNYPAPKHHCAHGCKYPAKVYTKKSFFPRNTPPNPEQPVP